MPGPTRPRASSNPTANGLTRPRRKVVQSHTGPRRRSSRSSKASSGDMFSSNTFIPPTPLQSSPASSIRALDSPDDVTDVMDLEALETDLYPLREMADRVGRQVEEFAEHLDALGSFNNIGNEPSKASVFDLIRKYRELAVHTVESLRERHGDEELRALRQRWQNHAEALRNKTSNTLSNGDDSSSEWHALRVTSSLNDLQAWSSEANTWSLLEGVLDCQLHDRNTQQGGNSDSVLTAVNDRFAADGDNWVQFLASDPAIRERHTVLKWLEESASIFESDIEVIEDELKRSAGLGEGSWSPDWMHTKLNIKKEKQFRPWKGADDTDHIPNIKAQTVNGSLVYHLDPDAVNRLHGVLEGPDQNLEDAFWIIAWEMLRRGTPMDKLASWCLDHSEPARAYMMGAHSLHHNSAFLSNDIIARYRWRKACRQAAQSGGLCIYERAVLGLLSGDLASVDRVAVGWEDHLYAAYNACLLAEYREFIRHHYSHSLPRENQFFFGEPQPKERSRSLEQISALLHPTEVLRFRKKGQFELIQASIIERNLEDLVVQEGVNLARRSQKSRGDDAEVLVPVNAATLSPQQHVVENLTDNYGSRRVLAHIYIVLRLLGLGFSSTERRAAADNVIIAYIDFLRLSGKTSIIPLYASYLQPGTAEEVLAKVLPKITNETEREDFVNLMSSMSIHVPGVLLRYQKMALSLSSSVKSGLENFVGLKILHPSKENKDKKSIWPGVYISREIDPGILDDEDAIVQSLEWVALLDSRWDEMFGGLVDSVEQLLLAGRLNPTIEIYQRLNATKLSRAKSPSYLGLHVDVLDDDDEGEDAPAPHNVPAQCRAHPEILRQALKSKALPYHELGQLVNALTCLWTFREKQDRRRHQLQHPTSTKHEGADLQRELAAALTHLQQAMEPVLAPGFLTKTRRGVRFDQERLYDDNDPPGGLDESRQKAQEAHATEAAHLSRIRRSYIPEIVLSYMAALHASSRMLSRERTLDMLDVGDRVARDKDLSACFTEAMRMRDMQDMQALGSKTLIMLNADKGSKHYKSKRDARSLEIWNV